MKKVTKEEIEERRKQRLKESSHKYRLRRNTWGISKDLNHSGLQVPDGFSHTITRDDIEDELVRNAIGRVRRIRMEIEGLSKLLYRVDPAKMPLICKELGVVTEIEEILTKENISENLKWLLIYNMDEVLKNET